MIEFKVTGFAELKQFLDKFPEQVQRECERRASMAGAKIVWDAARVNYAAASITERTGRTRKNIKMRKLSTGSRWEIHYGIGISRYGMFLELGTQMHTITPKRKKVLAATVTTLGAPTKTAFARNDRSIETEYEVFGTANKPRTVIGTFARVSAAARPFLRPAFYNNIKRIIDAERQVLGLWINKELIRNSSLATFLRSRR